jgi:deoxyribonuclease-4
MLLIGCHVSLSGKNQYLGSVQEALSYGANTFMIYTGAPQNTIRKPLEDMKIEEAKKLMQESNIDFNHVIVHAPYIVNLANPSIEKREFAISFLSEEVRRTEALGSKIMVLHPGAHMNEGSIEGIKRIASSITSIISNTSESRVFIALEGMAGKGSEIGRTFQELKEILDLIDNKNRVGICLDTCHIHDAGYDIINNFDTVLNQFEQIIGIDYLKVLHINDSKNEINSHKDRHENIGFGYIGFDALNNIVHHPLLKNLPKILETPYIKSTNNPILSYPPYKFEINMFITNKFNPNLYEIVVNANEEKKDL